MIGLGVEITEQNRNEAFGLTLDGHQKQDDLIFELITRLNRSNRADKFPTAHDINSYFEKMLITSIRRSLTNLKTNKMIEAAGRKLYRINGVTVPSTTYKIIEQSLQTKLF